MWKDIILDEKTTNYECSNTGLIRNKKTNQILKGKIKNNGYIEYTLYIDGTPHYVLGHCIIAFTYIPNENSALQINHKDGNKQNNNVDNLEWCTPQYNNQDAWNNGLNNADSTSIPVAQYTMDGVLVNTYKSFSEAIKATGIAKVREAAIGERNQAGGFLWSVLDDNYEKRDIGRKKKVGQFTLDGEFITEFESASEASRITGFYRKGISDCCNNKIKTSKGYIWRFI